MKRFNPKEIESKWQKKWDQDGTYTADLDSNKPKYIAMSMFNYPSGAGIHIGHAMNYTISDVNASLMKNEALLNGYDDAIALDHHGHVAEGTVANLFIVRGDKVATPDTSTDILEGITRDSLIEIIPMLGLSVEERSIDRTELYKSDEAFLCGSSARITPILSIDKRPVGSGKVGSVTRRLMSAYSDIQDGTAKDFEKWRKLAQ